MTKDGERPGVRASDPDEPSGASSGMRIDRWLWMARFYKTRSLATKAADGGHVRLNGARVKPAKEVRAGDSVEITIGDTVRTVLVQSMSGRRGPATEAQSLYVETPQSMAARAEHREQRRLHAAPGPQTPGRPTKRDRRALDRLRKTH